jgi:hypothetical protein
MPHPHMRTSTLNSLLLAYCNTKHDRRFLKCRLHSSSAVSVYRSTMVRHGKVVLKLHVFLSSASGQLYPEPLIFIWWEAEWPPEPVMTLWETKDLYSAGNGTQTPRLCMLYPSHYTEVNNSKKSQNNMTQKRKLLCSHHRMVDQAWEAWIMQSLYLILVSWRIDPLPGNDSVNPFPL